MVAAIHFLGSLVSIIFREVSFAPFGRRNVFLLNLVFSGSQRCFFCDQSVILVAKNVSNSSHIFHTGNFEVKMIETTSS